jgi:hypothetical protein
MQFAHLIHILASPRHSRRREVSDCPDAGTFQGLLADERGDAIRKEPRWGSIFSQQLCRNDQRFVFVLVTLLPDASCLVTDLVSQPTLSSRRSMTAGGLDRRCQDARSNRADMKADCAIYMLDEWHRILSVIHRSLCGNYRGERCS